MEVDLALTPDPGLLSAVEATVRVLAGQLGLRESKQQTLVAGVERACRRAFEHWPEGNGRELQLHFSSFSDRLEVVVDDGVRDLPTQEQDEFLLLQLVDRVSFEETEEGTVRITLVQFVPGVDWK